MPITSKLRKQGGRLVAVAALAVAAVGVAAQPASAATTYNIMLIGKEIPAGIGSADMGTWNTTVGCVHPLQPGVDKDTRLFAEPGRTLYIWIYRDANCQGDSVNNWKLTAPRDNGGLKNWWVSLNW